MNNIRIVYVVPLHGTYLTSLFYKACRTRQAGEASWTNSQPDKIHHCAVFVIIIQAFTEYFALIADHGFMLILPRIKHYQDLHCIEVGGRSDSTQIFHHLGSWWLWPRVITSMDQLHVIKHWDKTRGIIKTRHITRAYKNLKILCPCIEVKEYKNMRMNLQQ